MINERAQHLLKSLVGHYINNGQPVASSVLAKDASVSLSPATVRHVLADLEEAGYLVSPHTSSGRVPTAQGYRFFIDSLLKVQAFEEIDESIYQQFLKTSKSSPELLQCASSLLSGLSSFAGIVTLPKRNKINLKHIEFLPLSGNRVLSILVLSSGEIENRIVYAQRDYSRRELEQVANYLNQHFTGKSLSDIRRELLISMQNDKRVLDDLLQTMLDVAEKTFSSENTREDYLIEGQNNLLAEARDIQKVRDLFDVFSEKRDILALLDRCLEAEGMQIFIGEESGHQAFDQHSLVLSSYRVDDQVAGVLGVIGPTRMAYNKVIPIVDVTAKLLSMALDENN